MHLDRMAWRCAGVFLALAGVCAGSAYPEISAPEMDGSTALPTYRANATEDRPPTLTVSFDGLSGGVVAEGAGRVNVRLTLINPPASGGYTGCRLRLGAGGDAQAPADVTFSNQKKLKPNNGWAAQARLMTLVDDVLAEGDERLVVEGHCTGSKPGTQPPHTSLVSQPLVLTIADNDEPGEDPPPPPPPPTLTVSFPGLLGGAVAEDAGRVNAQLTLLDPPASGGYTGCRLRLGAGGAAQVSADVTFSNQKKLKPDNGWTAQAGLMTLVDDALVEGDESLVVEGHCTGSKPGTQPPHTSLVSQPLVLTIADNDSPDGDSSPTKPTDEVRIHYVPLFLSAADPLGREGFIRVINRGTEDAAIEIKAYDDSDWDYSPITLEVGAGGARHLNSWDLELGNADKGLSGGLGAGQGDWRLEFRSDAEIDVLAYIRTEDGFVTAMHDAVPLADDGYRVPFFNPASNTSQVSSLRLVNPGSEAAEVTITGLDDGGLSPGVGVTVTVPALGVRTLTSTELEAGGDGVTGALGDGAGKWRLLVESEQPIIVMSLLESPTGHLTNLSTTPHGNAFTVRE